MIQHTLDIFLDLDPNLTSSENHWFILSGLQVRVTLCLLRQCTSTSSKLRRHQSSQRETLIMNTYFSGAVWESSVLHDTEPSKAKRPSKHNLEIQNKVPSAVSSFSCFPSEITVPSVPTQASGQRTNSVVCSAVLPMAFCCCGCLREWSILK